MKERLESAFEENDTFRYLTEQATQLCHIQNRNNERYVMDWNCPRDKERSS